ncbi:hypothetical protein Tco_1025894 [Tanacetum coccineum]
MKRASKGYTRVDTPLLQTMLVPGQTLQDEGLTIIVESHHIPTSALSTSQAPTSSPSMPTTHVAEKAALMPYDSPLPRVHSLRSDEGSLTLNELTILYTSLSKKVESLESDLKQTKQTYGAAYTKLITKVKKLEHKGRSDEDLMYETGVYDYLEGFTGLSISITTVEPVITAGKGVSTAREIPKEVSTAEPDMDVTLTEVLMDLLKSGKKKSPKPKARGISFQDPEEVARRESDEELALRLYVEEQAEFEKLQKEKATQEEASRAAIYEEMDNIQAMIEADEQLATRFQDEEQELYFIEEK